MKYFNGDEYTGEWVNELVSDILCFVFLICRMFFKLSINRYNRPVKVSVVETLERGEVYPC